MRIPRVSWCLLVAAILIASLCAPVFAAADRWPTTPGELDDALSAQIEDLLATYRIPGATVSVVADGELLFAKGYGWADIDQNRPVVADETLFGVASVTKLFLWTAVMQLVEQGLVDLHADVQNYLGNIRIPATYDEPITLAHLMTHTAGFAEITGPLFGKELPILSDYLAAHMPNRIFRPGAVTANSNYGAALAAYIVERVTGVPCPTYIEEHILQPLGMDSSSLAQPLPGELAARESASYALRFGKIKRNAPLLDLLLAAGGLSATATDMAAFMIAHLQGGQYGDARILSPETADEMHRRQFANEPRLPGVCYGFLEYFRNGFRVIQHGGDADFHSILALVPDRNVGVFFAINSAGSGNGSLITQRFLVEFLDRWFPPTVEAGEGPDATAVGVGNARSCSGTYLPTRRVESGLLGLVYRLLGVRVRPLSDRSIRMTGLMLDKELTEVEPLLFTEVGGSLKVAFTEDDRGAIRLMQHDDFPAMAYEKLHPTETPGFALGFVGFLAALAALAVLL